MQGSQCVFGKESSSSEKDWHFIQRASLLNHGQGGKVCIQSENTFAVSEEKLRKD